MTYEWQTASSVLPGFVQDLSRGSTSAHNAGAPSHADVDPRDKPGDDACYGGRQSHRHGRACPGHPRRRETKRFEFATTRMARSPL
jgi:hypothetical protein